MGIDPVTHKPFSHLIAEITTTLAPPQVTHLAEAALGCFKDEVLHLLTKKRLDPAAACGGAPAEGLAGFYGAAAADRGFGFGASSSSYCDTEGAAWSQSLCAAGSACNASAAGPQCVGVAPLVKGEDGGEETEGCGGGRDAGEADAAVFAVDCMMWDLSDDLMDAIV